MDFTLFCAYYAGIPKEAILTNHRVTEVRWYGVDVYDRSESVSINESGNESDDSGKTVIDVGAEKKVHRSTTNTLSVPSGSTDGVPVAATAEKSGVEIVCENGVKLRADSAICTIPLGVLKEHITNMFIPALPEYKIESVERLLFGTVNKIFLGYDRPFLNANISEVLLLWDTDCDKSKTDNG